MAERRYLVMDIETITDRNLIAQVFGIRPDASIEEVREQIKAKYTNSFAPPPFHIPICIALIDVDSETFKVQNATVLENNDEKALLQQFWRIVKFRKGNTPVRTTFVTFNGRSFDAPVLFYRSLKHRVPIVASPDRSRYNFEYSHDICDDLSEFGATSRPSLDVVSKLLGLPGKTDIHGSQIEELYLSGERARIKDYCMEDALSTYYIWITIKLIRGEINEEKHRQAFDTAADIVKDRRSRTDTFFSTQ